MTDYDKTLAEIVTEAMEIAGDTTPEPLTSEKVRHIAGLGLDHPERVSHSQIQKLCGSVLAHIEPRKRQ